ncbi:MAG TPA: ABC transporter permease subunit [Candidatus Binataceae bacterium]|jgi:multiple sugar transport system permease protein|nr:ABC transporter permease subunit [Candidatus Binataceae bacterium]
MNRRAGAGWAAVRAAIAAAIVLGAALPLYLLLKQAITPERESFAWPPLWLPHRIVGTHLHAVFALPELRGAILLSLGIALLSAALATALGAMLGYAMARSGAGRAAGFGALTAARLLPMIAVAIPLAIGMGRVGLYDSPSGLGLALVHSALALPVAALMVYPAFAALPREVEEAAWLDGASPARVFVLIDLPQARGALAGAFVMAFILSWDEFGYALLIQVTHRTLPPLLYYYMVFGDVGAASALALLMMVPAVCLVIALGPMLRGAMAAGGLR